MCIIKILRRGAIKGSRRHHFTHCTILHEGFIRRDWQQLLRWQWWTDWLTDIHPATWRAEGLPFCRLRRKEYSGFPNWVDMLGTGEGNGYYVCCCQVSGKKESEGVCEPCYSRSILDPLRCRLHGGESFPAELRLRIYHSSSIIYLIIHFSPCPFAHKDQTMTL